MLPGRQYTPGDFALMAWRRRWVIIVPVILGAYAALIVSSRVTDMFQSEMLIQVVPQRVPDAYVRSTVTMRTEDRLNAIAEEIKSRTELERLITQLDLYSAERARLAMQDVVDLMRSQIVVDPVLSQGQARDAEAFYVRFSYRDAETVRRVTERLGALFINVNARDRGNQAQATNNFMQTQLADARLRLEEQEQKLERFREQHAGRLPTQLQFNMQAMQNSQLSVQAVMESLARDRDRKLMLERLYLDAQAEPIVPGQAPPQPAAQRDPPAVAEVPTDQQLAATRTVLTRLELRLKPEHPDIVRTKRLIGELESRLAEETKARAETAATIAAAPAVPATVPVPSASDAARRQRLQQMQAEIESLQRQIDFKQAQEERLRASLAQYQQRIEQVPGVESDWISLTRDYDTLQSAYKELLTKSEDAKLAADLEQRQIGEQFRIIDPARTPVRPTSVKRLQINAIGAGIGLALGLGLAALLQFRDRTFRAAADVVEVFRLPVVAVVPQLVSAADRRRTRRQRLAVAGAVTAVVLAGGYVFRELELWKYVA